MSELTRRHVLGTTVGLTGALALGALGGTPAVAAEGGAASPTAWKGDRSANGWEILDKAPSHGIEGSGRTVRLREGDAATLLLHVARRFHYEIDQLRAGDVRGHRDGAKVREAFESNYLSGTPIEIRPLAYPLGAEGGFYPQELVVIRDILAELDGAAGAGAVRGRTAMSGD